RFLRQSVQYVLQRARRTFEEMRFGAIFLAVLGQDFREILRQGELALFLAVLRVAVPDVDNRRVLAAQVDMIEANPNRFALLDAGLEQQREEEIGARVRVFGVGPPGGG